MLLLEEELASWFVVCMGVGIVFVGLICLIIICTVMGAICKRLIKEKPQTAAPAPAAAAAVAAPVSQEIPNRQEFVAAVSAAIAEEMGTDVTGIRIHSIKKL